MSSTSTSRVITPLRLSEETSEFVNADDAHVLCRDELRQWFDIPDNVREIDLVATKRRTEYNYYVKLSPWAGVTFTHVDGVAVSSYEAFQSLIFMNAKKGYKYYHIEYEDE